MLYKRPRNFPRSAGNECCSEWDIKSGGEGTVAVTTSDAFTTCSSGLAQPPWRPEDMCTGRKGTNPKRALQREAEAPIIA